MATFAAARGDWKLLLALGFFVLANSCVCGCVCSFLRGAGRAAAKAPQVTRVTLVAVLDLKSSSVWTRASDVPGEANETKAVQVHIGIHMKKSSLWIFSRDFARLQTNIEPWQGAP